MSSYGVAIVTNIRFGYHNTNVDAFTSVTIIQQETKWRTEMLIKLSLLSGDPDTIWHQWPSLLCQMMACYHYQTQYESNVHKNKVVTFIINNIEDYVFQGPFCLWTPFDAVILSHPYHKYSFESHQGCCWKFGVNENRIAIFAIYCAPQPIHFHYSSFAECGSLSVISKRSINIAFIPSLLFYISVPYCTSLNKYSNMRSAKDCSQYQSYTLVTYEPSLTLIKQPQWKMGLLPDTQNGILRMRRECRERFPRHRGLAIPTCITARAWRTCRGSCRDR